MIRPESEQSSITTKAEAAFQDVRQSVLERARQTKTPIIVFRENRIQSLSPEEFEKLGSNTNGESKPQREGG